MPKAAEVAAGVEEPGAALAEARQEARAAPEIWAMWAPPAAPGQETRPGRLGRAEPPRPPAPGKIPIRALGLKATLKLIGSSPRFPLRPAQDSTLEKDAAALRSARRPLIFEVI